MVAGLAFLATMIVWAVIVAVLMRRTLRRTPARIVKALRTTNADVRVRVPMWPAGVGTWNPAKPLGRNNPIFEPGTGTYHVDSTGTVELEWQPRTGPPQTFRGNTPSVLEPGSAHRRRLRKIGGAVLGVYLIFAVGGFSAGFLLSSGTTGRRLGFGLGGVAVAFILIWIVVLLVNVVFSTRTVHRRDQTPRQPTT